MKEEYEFTEIDVKINPGGDTKSVWIKLAIGEYKYEQSFCKKDITDEDIPIIIEEMKIELIEKIKNKK